MESNVIIKATPSKMDFLVSHENSTACIILVEKAVEQYQNTFKKLNVPYSYIGFFCSEFNKYSGLFTNKLKDYYDGFAQYNVTTEDLIDIYVRSKYSQHQEVKNTKYDKLLCFKDKIILSFTKEIRQVKNLSMSTMVENIINICSKIDHQDELLDNVELYEQYMINQFLKDYQFNLARSSKKRSEDASDGNDPAKKLVGTAMDDIYEPHGKVTRVIIPKLSLPTEYPIDLENSRLTENKVSHKFCSPAKQIVFINRKKIVAIKYSPSFVFKRTESKKKPFNWDF